MSISKSEALGIVAAIEETSDYIDGDDHSHAVVSTALRDLSQRLAELLAVPGCTCRWGHDEKYGDPDCPRNGFGGGE